MERFQCGIIVHESSHERKTLWHLSKPVHDVDKARAVVWVWQLQNEDGKTVNEKLDWPSPGKNPGEIDRQSDDEGLNPSVVKKDTLQWRQMIIENWNIFFLVRSF